MNKITQQKTKTCTKCKTKKTVWEFSINRKSKDGLQCWCRECAFCYGIQYREANREALASKARDRRACLKFFQTLAAVDAINEAFKSKTYNLKPRDGGQR